MSAGHYRPRQQEEGPPQRRGVSGFVKGAALFSLDDSKARQRGECSDEEEGGRMGQRQANTRRRREEEDDDDDDDPAALYTKLTASSGSTTQQRPAKAGKRKRDSFLCLVCETEVSAVSKEEHERSTLHIFSQKKQNTARRIVLPDNNRGVQILGRLGWSGETGLGVEEQGKIEPAKSILKLDTKGLGHKQPKPGTKSAAERAHEEFEKRKREEKKEHQVVMQRASLAPESRKDRVRRETKERRQRDKIRMELNADLPEGYEEYFR